MASPEELTRDLPETLPDDFSEWDNWESETVPAAAPAKPVAVKASRASVEVARPHAQPVEREAALPRVIEKPRNVHPAAPEQQSASELLDELVGHAPHKREEAPAAVAEPVKPSRADARPAAKVPSAPHKYTSEELRKADEELFEMFSGKAAEVQEEKKAKSKKWVIAAVVGAVVVLLAALLFTIPLLHRGASSAANQPASQANGAGLTAEAEKPSASVPVAQDEQPATAQTPAAANSQTDNKDQKAEPAQAVEQSKPVNNQISAQLNAPSRIPQNMKQAGAAPPPANLGADALGGGGLNAGGFSRQARPNVKGAPIISASLAAGMLIHKTAPAYPPIAKAARVSGVVQLQATITKSGTVTDIHVVSGPVMLRQAAVDAVKNWRYKPYMLNNQPIEIDTTISINFALGG